MKEVTPPTDLGTRLKQFAVRVIKLYGALPKTVEAQVIGKQLLRSGTSVGAHYAEASRGRSTKEFVSKIEAGQQELQETIYWFELLIEADIVSENKLSALITEANELMAILVTVVKRAKNNRG